METAGRRTRRVARGDKRQASRCRLVDRPLLSTERWTRRATVTHPTDGPVKTRCQPVSQSDAANRLKGDKMARRSWALAVLALLSRSCYCRAAVSDDQPSLSLDRVSASNFRGVTQRAKSSVSFIRRRCAHNSCRCPPG